MLNESFSDPNVLTTDDQNTVIYNIGLCMGTPNGHAIIFTADPFKYNFMASNNSLKLFKIEALAYFDIEKALSEWRSF